MLTQKIQDERDEREIYTHNRGGGERHGCRGKWLGLMSLDLCAGERGGLVLHTTIGLCIWLPEGAVGLLGLAWCCRP